MHGFISGRYPYAQGFTSGRYPYMHGFISELSILFHWSVFLFLSQYHTVLMTVAL